MEEKELIKGLKRKDEEAFRIFIGRYKDSIYRIIYSVAGAAGGAEDIAQEVFIAVFKKIGKFNEKSSLSTWLYRIAVNKCMDYFRKNKMKTLELKDNLIFERDNSEERKKIAISLISTLPVRERFAMTMKAVEGFSNGEIADALNTTEGNVRIILFRARERLKKEAKKYGIT
ncbi:MAG: RNA polymerase sigma factor [Elusimicrobia bacterium]|nr:RNA polymerase sigma factor [Elusimicrobiota bacterium]